MYLKTLDIDNNSNDNYKLQKDYIFHLLNFWDKWKQCL
jgi:hypothetical protein